MGNPQSVLARTVRKPAHSKPSMPPRPSQSSTRQSKRVFVAHQSQPQLRSDRQHSFVQWEGLRAQHASPMASTSTIPPASQIRRIRRARLQLSSLALPPGRRQQLPTPSWTWALCNPSPRSASTCRRTRDAFQPCAGRALYRSSELPGEPLPLDE